MPRRDCPGAEGAGQAVPAVSAPGPGLPVPLCMSPPSPDLGVSPAAEPTLAPPKDGGVSRLKELHKVSGAPCVLGVGPHLQPQSSPPERTAPSAERCANLWDLSRGIKAKGEEGDTSPGCIHLTQLRTGRAVRLWLPQVTGVGQEEMLPPCGRSL